MSETIAQARQIIEELRGRFVELGGAVPEEWRTLPLKELSSAIRYAEARERNNCHSVVFDIIGGSGDMQPTPLQAYFLVCRCRCALETLDTLAVGTDVLSVYAFLGDSERNEPPAEKIVHWLLDPIWDHRHDAWMKLTAFGIATNNHYYSG